MIKFIDAKLPNPESSTDPQWAEWDCFLVAHGIQVCREPVVQRYQCLDHERCDLLPDDRLNHLLTLEAEGVGSDYARESEDLYGGSPDLEERKALHNTLSAFDEVFLNNGYRFSDDSVVYKGVGTKLYYAVHHLSSVVEGRRIKFHGFLSTSVCREKGKAFAGSNGILLVITGLRNVDCVIPENKQVINTPDSQIPEQEVLLNRGTEMLVLKVLPGNGEANRELHLQIV